MKKDLWLYLFWLALAAISISVGWYAGGLVTSPCCQCPQQVIIIHQ